jgi:hypothetical protein
MKSFTEYLTESKKTYTFRIKLAKEISGDDVTRIENHLAKYDVQKVSAPTKLMLQSVPYDFPQLRGYEIFVIEFETNLPASAYQIQTEIQTLLGISDGFMKVRSDQEPLEQREQALSNDKSDDKESTSLLADGTYSEAEDVNAEDFFGDKYNTSFVQELLKLKKEQEKKDA